MEFLNSLDCSDKEFESIVIEFLNSGYDWFDKFKESNPNKHIWIIVGRKKDDSRYIRMCYQPKNDNYPTALSDYGDEDITPIIRIHFNDIKSIHRERRLNKVLNK